MATEREATTATFTNPVLRFRLRMVRGLQLVEELERATARSDYWTAQSLAHQANEILDLAKADALAAVTDLEAAETLVAIALADPDDLAHDDAQAIQASLDGATDPELPASELGQSGGVPGELLTEAEARAAWGDR